MLLVKTTIGESKINNIGLFAGEFIPTGKIIWQWHHGFDQIFDPNDVDTLPEPARTLLIQRAYFSKYLQKYVLCGDDARFMNHSTTPNTRDSGGHDFQGTTIAIRDIQPNEEITINYFEYDEDATWKVMNDAPMKRTVK
jgi:uncharacterized protein